MVLTRFALLSLLTSLTSACNAVQNLADKKDDKKDGASETTQAEPPPADQAKPEDKKADEPLDESTSFGLADFCTFAQNAKGEGCFTCTPRDLPDTRCSAVPEGFDPKTACQHDLDTMTCKVTGDKDFVYDFNKESNDEKLYNKVPLLLIGAKALLADKLKDKPETKELVYSALDVVDKYKKDVFTNGNLDPMVDELAAIVKKAKPNYEQAKIDDFKAQAKSIIKGMQEKRAKGQLDTASMLTTFTDVLNQLPDDLIAPIMENLDLSKITSALSGAGGDDAIQALLQIFGGGKSVDEIIQSLEAPDPKANP